MSAGTEALYRGRSVSCRVEVNDVARTAAMPGPACNEDVCRQSCLEFRVKQGEEVSQPTTTMTATTTPIPVRATATTTKPTLPTSHTDSLVSHRTTESRRGRNGTSTRQGQGSGRGTRSCHRRHRRSRQGGSGPPPRGRGPSRAHAGSGARNDARVPRAVPLAGRTVPGDVSSFFLRCFWWCVAAVGCSF